MVIVINNLLHRKNIGLFSMECKIETENYSGYMLYFSIMFAFDFLCIEIL